MDKAAKEEIYFQVLRETFKAKRNEMGKKQYEVAEMIDVDTAHYGKLETGLKNPGSYTTFKIFTELQIDFNEFNKEFQAKIKELE